MEILPLELPHQPVEILMTLQLPDLLLERIRAINPRLSVRTIHATRAEDVPAEAWAIADVLYTARVLPLPEQAPRLRWIQFHYAGVDHAREAAIMQRSGLIATTMSGAAATQMAEYLLMMLLALGHRLPDMLDHQRRNLWPKDRWERFRPHELRESTVGILGYGSIGRQLARLLHPLGALVLATKRDARHPEDSGYNVEGWGDPNGDFVHRLYPGEALRSMARTCDYLVVCAPLTPQTRGVVNADIFSAMKPTACLVDVSRGGVVDHAALIDALHEKRIAGAALDVFPEEPLPAESPLWKMPNVIITPHIAGNTPHYDERAVDMFTANLRRFLNGVPLLNIIDAERGY
jgi:phosphoglycerate dehydrogenase-like enzyme